VAALLVAGASGCGMVPRSRLDDCRKQCQTLQAETAQLRDTTLQLRGQNREYAQRAIDDAGRLQALEAANRQLEKDVIAYQRDVGRMEAAFDQLRQQVQGAAATAMGDGEPAAAGPR
jgi:chemotaxis protein MotB